MKNKIIIACAIGAIVVGGVSFYGGMKYQQSNTSQRGNFSMQNVPAGQRQGTGISSRGANGAAGVGMASGEIIAKDDKSMTVKLRDGGSKIVFYAGSTQLQKLADATQDDFAVGKQIVASGAANSDGSITAQSIQLRPDIQPVKN